MSSDSDERFDVFFAGELLPGCSEDAVRGAVQKLFRLDSEALERLFSGDRRLIKRACDRETALRYQRALKQAGARPIITHAAAVPAPGDADAAPMPTAPDFSLAEPGSDVLRPEERSADAVAEIATDHLQLSEVGAQLGESAAPVPARPAPDLELADAGAALAPPSPPTPEPPATPGMELVAGELDLSDCAPATAEPPDLGLDHLELSPAGSALLSEEEKPTDQARAPDTDHLSLISEDPEDGP